MKQKPKIAVILPFSPMGGAVYTLFHYHIVGMEDEFRGNLKFYPLSPAKFQKTSDIVALNNKISFDFPEKPDYILVFNMHMSYTNIDGDVYAPLEYNKSFIGLDYIDYEAEISDKKRFSIIPVMESNNFMSSIMETVLLFCNMLKPKGHKLANLYMNNNRAEFLTLSAKHEKCVFTDKEINRLGTLFWSSGSDIYNKPAAFTGVDRDAPDLFIGYRMRMRDGFGGYYKLAYESSINSEEAKLFQFCSDVNKYEHVYLEGDVEKKMVMVKGVDGLSYDNAAYHLLSTGYNAVFMLSHRNDLVYFYNNFMSPVSMEKINGMFNMFTKSDRRGMMFVDDSVINTFNDQFS